MARIIPHEHGGGLAEALEYMPSEDAFNTAARVFSYLSDATRLRILWLLCHCEDCVTNIAAAVGISDPAVSHHLRILNQAGLITRRREGKEVYYTLAASEEAKLCHRMADDVFNLSCK